MKDELSVPELYVMTMAGVLGFMFGGFLSAVIGPGASPWIGIPVLGLMLVSLWAIVTGLLLMFKEFLRDDK